MAKSIADLFDDRKATNNSSSNIRSNNDAIASNESRQKFQRVEQAIAKDPLELMSPEDAKQVTASNVNMNDVISEIGSMWSGKKTVEGSRDLSKYASKNDINDDDDEGED